MSLLPLKPTVIFVLGGPGSGKGTQSERLARSYGYVHLSAGELLRQERASGSAEGALIEEYLTEGKIVPVELSLGLLKKAMVASGGTRFLIDGFPRNQDNLEGWQRVMASEAEVAAVLFLECPEAVLEARLLLRGLSSGRSDDNLESARKRFKTYVDTTLPVVKHFEALGLVKLVDASQDVETVFQQTVAALAPTMHKEVLACTQVLLEAARTNNVVAYEALCAPDATGAGCPEAACASSSGSSAAVTAAQAEKWGLPQFGSHWTMRSPRVRLLGDSAVVTYQRIAAADSSSSTDATVAIPAAPAAEQLSTDETRVWKVMRGAWRQVHLHRAGALR